MSDTDAGAAPAAPAPEAVPAAPSVPEQPSASARDAVKHAFAAVAGEDTPPPRPLSSQTKPVEKPEPKAEKAPEKKAEAKPVESKAKPAEKAPTPKNEPPEKLTGQARTPTGQFAPKVAAEGEGAEAVTSPAPAPKPSSFPEAPKRFSADAQAAWNDTPEPVRAEVNRATREMEQGLQKYRADAEAFDQVRQFDDLAKRSGTTLAKAMANYVGIERQLQTDFIGGLERICANRGLSLRDVAAKIVGATPDQNASRQDAVIRGLNQKIAQLEQQVGGVSKTIEQQRTEGAMSQVAAFAAEKGHERFEELAQDISFLLSSKRAADLNEAYQLAERLNPGPAPVAAPPPAPAPAPVEAAQTRKGTLGIHGAPSSGSDPATRKPPSSTREAVKRALAQVANG